MNTEEIKARLQQLNGEMYLQTQIANDVENQQSDDVIRARKEVQRIKHDISELLKD
jgi:hypothetical protein